MFIKTSEQIYGEKCFIKLYTTILAGAQNYDSDKCRLITYICHTSMHNTYLKNTKYCHRRRTHKFVNQCLRCGKGYLFTQHDAHTPVDRGSTEAQFLVPDWGDKVHYGIGLSYRPARLHRQAAGGYDNPMP